MTKEEPANVAVLKIVDDGLELAKVFDNDEVVGAFKDGEVIEGLNRMRAFYMWFDSTFEKVEWKSKQG